LGWSRWGAELLISDSVDIRCGLAKAVTYKIIWVQDQPAALSEEARKFALDRFRLIQPHIEQDQSMASVAQTAPFM